MPKKDIRGIPADVVAKNAKSVEEIREEKISVPEEEVSAPVKLEEIPVKEEPAKEDLSDTLKLSFDDIDKQDAYREIVKFTELLIEDEEDDIKALQQKIQADVKELEERVKRRKERIDTLRDVKRQLLIKGGDVIERQSVLYEFTRNGEQTFSTEYDDVLKYSDDPRTVKAHMAVWNGKKWVIK